MRPCSICGSVDARRVYSLPNGDLLRCRVCGTMRRENLVDEAAARDLYDEGAYLEAPYFEAVKVGAPRDREPYLVYQRVLDGLAARGLSGRLLDLGCSYGAFLDLASEHGWRSSGVELSGALSVWAARHRA